MKDSGDYKEKYLKYVVIIAITLITLGIGLVYYFQNGVPFIVASTFIQLGITLFVVDLLISNFASKLFRQEIIKNFREVMGITDPQNKLFPELIRLIRPHPYHVLNSVTNNKLVYDKNRKKKYNMTIIEKSTLQVQALEDNVHYNFICGSESGPNSNDNLKEVRLNEALLDKDKDLIITNNKEKKVIEYIVKHKLKKGETYKFEILYNYPQSMSDLNFGNVKDDTFIQEFIELTNKAKLTFEFPFDLKDYVFMIKRCDACKRETLLVPKPNKNIIVVEQENLDNGDSIEITYKKK